MTTSNGYTALPHAACSHSENDPAVAALVAEPEGRDEQKLFNPIARNSEVLFGLFMVLSYTGTVSVAHSGREDVKLMLIEAIGCNIAWGFVDGVMFVLRALVGRARRSTLDRAVRMTQAPEVARRLIARELGPLAGGLGSTGLENLRLWSIQQAPPSGIGVRVTGHDLRCALGVFMLVFLSTFPVVLPFVFIESLQLAMRVSAAVSITMMFFCGYSLGRYGGLPPWLAGLTMVLLGSIVEAIIVALGG